MQCEYLYSRLSDIKDMPMKHAAFLWLISIWSIIHTLKSSKVTYCCSHHA